MEPNLVCRQECAMAHSREETALCREKLQRFYSSFSAMTNFDLNEIYERAKHQ